MNNCRNREMGMMEMLGEDGKTYRHFGFINLNHFLKLNTQHPTLYALGRIHSYKHAEGRTTTLYLSICE